MLENMSGSRNSVPLPYTLNGGHQVFFVIEKSELGSSLTALRQTNVKIRAYVTTPVHGKVYSPKFKPNN